MLDDTSLDLNLIVINVNDINIGHNANEEGPNEDATSEYNL